jgi:hypothetical protein
MKFVITHRCGNNRSWPPVYARFGSESVADKWGNMQARSLKPAVTAAVQFEAVQFEPLQFEASLQRLVTAHHTAEPRDWRSWSSISVVVACPVLWLGSMFLVASRIWKQLSVQQTYSFNLHSDAPHGCLWTWIIADCCSQVRMTSFGESIDVRSSAQGRYAEVCCSKLTF